MAEAIDEHEGLRDDEEAKTKLMLYFQYTAHYIIGAKQYMRTDQLSGGNKIDPGRIW